MSEMALIDWAGVARNALWIIGLSLALAALSHSCWQASRQRSSLRLAFGRQAFQALFSVGLLLFSAAMTWGATVTWERSAWIILAGAFAWQAIRSRRSNHE